MHWRPLCPPPLCTLSITSCKPAGAIQTDISHGQKRWSLNVSCAKPVAHEAFRDHQRALKGAPAIIIQNFKIFVMIIIIKDVLMAHMEK